MTPQEQHIFANKMSEQLEKMTMSWDTELRQWYNTAIKALNFTSAYRIKISCSNFYKLLEQEKYGLNMNIVSFLIKNVEERSAHEMNVTLEDWSDYLLLTARIESRWSQLCEKDQERILKEMELAKGVRKNGMIIT